MRWLVGCVPVVAGLAAVFTLHGTASGEVKYSDLSGYSVEVEWTDTPVFKSADGRTGSKGRTLRETLYLGAKGHIFERTTTEQSEAGAFNKGLQHYKKAMQTDTEKSENVSALGETSKDSQWTFEGGGLVKMRQFPEGAQRLVIDLAGSDGAFTCSLQVKDLRKNGAGKIVLTDGSTVEVVSRTVSVHSCKVEKGNLISGGQ
jgi:hypothetical protein